MTEPNPLVSFAGLLLGALGWAILIIASGGILGLAVGAFVRAYRAITNS